MTSTRSQLYRAARLLGDFQALERGPLPYAKRLVRKRVYKATNLQTSRWLRTAHLSGTHHGFGR